MGVWHGSKRCEWVCGMVQKDASGCVAWFKKMRVGVWHGSKGCEWVCGMVQRGVSGRVIDALDMPPT